VSTPALLLTTKLYLPPARPNLVTRPRLIERLKEGLARPLTLVSAPAGFGKTTLVTEWLHSAERPFTWLSLDEGDNDPARFLAYFVAALQKIDPAIGQAALAMLQTPQPPSPEALLTSLINDIAATSQPFVLVLDDYHLIHTLPIHQQLAFLLEHQPLSMHLAIVSREDPPLPLARLRGRGQTTEIRQADLSFTEAEAVEFLRRVMRLELSSADVAVLHQRTEGWVVGLQLVALSLQGSDDVHRLVQSFTGSHRSILDYFIEEVFQRQPADVQGFLLKTSILDRFTASLCDAVVERDDSREVLLALERANLFIAPLDEARQWYRYHHLFADLLRHRIDVGLRQSASLHRRASQWYADNGFLAEAVRHALAGANWERSARLIGQASDGMLRRGEIVTLLGWFGKLPKEVACADPQLCMSYAWAALLASQFEIAEPLLEHAEKLALPESQFLGQVAAAQAYLARARGDNPRLIVKSEQALSLLPKTDYLNRGLVALNLGLTYWHAGRLEDAEPVLSEAHQASERVGNIFAVLTAQFFLARTLAVRGKLRPAEAMCQKLIQEGGNSPILALVHYDLSTIYYEWNDLQKAGEHQRRGLEMSMHSENVEFQNSGHIERVFLALAQGDSDGALEAVEQSHALARDLNPATRARSAACHVQLALTLGDLDMAAHWARQVMEDVDAHSFYRFLGLTQPRLLIASGQKDAAAEQLAECFETASRGGWGYGLVAVRVLQSLAAKTPDEALPFMADALKMGQPEGFIRSFVDAGRGIIPLLQEAARRGVHPDYVRQILAALSGEHKIAAPEQAQLVEPLSERELEVLRLVTAGLSNREVAAKLVISPGTAKTHIHNLCGKLSVRNRTEAAMRAKELGLV
jgi:LuxR family maltose regulon positive regulatory protein